MYTEIHFAFIKMCRTHHKKYDRFFLEHCIMFFVVLSQLSIAWTCNTVNDYFIVCSTFTVLLLKCFPCSKAHYETTWPSHMNQWPFLWHRCLQCIAFPSTLIRWNNVDLVCPWECVSVCEFSGKGGRDIVDVGRDPKHIC